MSGFYSVGISTKVQKLDLPSVYFIYKLHKRPYTYRYIAWSHKCATNPSFQIHVLYQLSKQSFRKQDVLILNSTLAFMEACVIYIFVLWFSYFLMFNLMLVIWILHCLNITGASEFTLVFSEVVFAQCFFFFCVMFCRSLFVLLSFFFLAFVLSVRVRLATSDQLWYHQLLLL